MPERQERLMTRVLDGARRKLLETGTRNSLVHVNRANKRGNFLNIVNERTDDVFDLLRVQAKRLRFKPMGKDPGPSAGEPGDQFALALPPDASVMRMAGRLTTSVSPT